MDSYEKNQSQQKEEIGRTIRTRELSADRSSSTTKKGREKANQGRKSEKSTLSSQKSPFKSKYSSDKQFSRTTFGHSGLSSKCYSRRHIQDNGMAYYAKPKLGKIAKEMKKNPPGDKNAAAKKDKSAKRYAISGSTGGGTSQTPPEEPAKLASSNLIVLDKAGNGRSPENAPRHRKCYTNSKHAELSKSLKLNNGLGKEVKISQSSGNLKNSSIAEDMKHSSSDDIQKFIEKEEAHSSSERDGFLKVNSCKSTSKSENQLSTNNNSGTKTSTIKFQMKNGGSTTNLPEPDIDKIEIDSKLDIGQSKYCSTYFYKGSDTKMNFERSNISGVKILLRGDLLGALNCLFPQLNLVPSDANPKRPVLDPNFSYFSDTKTFALTRKRYNNHPTRPKDVGKSFHKEKYNLLSLIESHILLHIDRNRRSHEISNDFTNSTTSTPSYTKDMDNLQAVNECKADDNQNVHAELLNIPFTSIGNKYSEFRSVASAKEFELAATENTKDNGSSKFLKIASDIEATHMIKSNKSEPIMSSRTKCHNIRLNTSLDNFMENHKPATSTPLCKRSAESTCEDLDQVYMESVLASAYPERCKQSRDDIEIRIAKLEKLMDSNESSKAVCEFQGSVNSPACGNNRSLYSTVLKNSIASEENVEQSLQLDAHHKEPEEIKFCDEKSELNAVPVSFVDFDTDMIQSFIPSKTTLEPENKITKSKPICYNLDELEDDITRTLEKLIEDTDDPELYRQYSDLEYNNAFNLNNFSNQCIANQPQNKIDDVSHRKTNNNSGLNSLQSRLNFLRTKGRPSDFKQFFNPLAFNTQLATQFIRQNNAMSGMATTTPIDNIKTMTQIFPKTDLTKLNPSNMQYYQQNSGSTFERDLKELRTRYPQIIQNNNNIAQQNFMNASSTGNLTAHNPFHVSALYAQLSSNKVQAGNLAQSLPKSNTADENLILNQFFASQNLENIYANNLAANCYPTMNAILPNQYQLYYGQEVVLVMNQNPFAATNYYETSSGSGMGSIISVSDLEKQALEQYRSSDENINARYEALEKEAEEQYNNFLGQK